MPAGSSTNAAPTGAVSCALPLSGSGSSIERSNSASSDRVAVTGLMPRGIADGPLAFRVGPPGAVGGQLAAVADEQAADDPSKRLQLGFRGLKQPGPDVVSET
jgi:hypothetical protein